MAPVGFRFPGRRRWSMDKITLSTGQIVYDPRGKVEAQPKPLAPRVSSLGGLRIGVLDNTKWNGRKLLEKTVDLLKAEQPIREVHFYQKESFSKNATSALIEKITRENDVVITAIGD
jgi:hypothetical protein